MRLLKLLPNGDFQLIEFLGEVPRYAILSHTWESEEVTFEDMKQGSGLPYRDRAGYVKLKFCGEQAAKDGLQHFWVDSCCIKKSSDAELSESLNSMFRWYRRAERCYVYLSDVSIRKRKGRDENSRDTWKQAFRQSRWFTRGWTLQELLAPLSVEFFSKEGNRIGDKQSLEQQIHEITRIPISALRGSALSHFSAEQKFDWAKNRQTTRDEDWAYSLLGIFEIAMPVTYGEGRANAVRRLRKEIDDAWKDKECLRHLYVTDPRKDKIRIEETNGGLIVDSYRWIMEHCDFKQWRNDQQSRLLWIKGDPGKGKTMLLCGIINELERSKADTQLLSFFYCQANDSRINNATAVLRGLLYLLIQQQPSLILHIQKQHDHAGKALFEDPNAWVALSDIFTNVLQDSNLKSTYLIIDALDECTVDLPKLLDFIIQRSSTSQHVKWLVSSRNEDNIERRLQFGDSRTRLSLELRENAEQVLRAVDAYIDHRISKLIEIQFNKELQDSVKEKIQRKANGTFLWVALIMKELEEAMSWEILQVLDEVPIQLKDVYRRMIKQIKGLQRQYPELCLRVLSIIVAAYRPLHLQELHILSDLPTQVHNVNSVTTSIVKKCGSFLTIRDDSVYIIHQSAKEFLRDETSHDIFPHGLGDVHYSIFSKSLHILSRTLRRDIYGLHTPGYAIERVEQPDPDPLMASRYSCIYWVDHLCEWQPHSRADHIVDLQDGGIVEIFVRKKYLYWLEALSLCRSMPEGVFAMAKLEALFQRRADVLTLFELVQDARRFIIYNKQAIEISPLQVYASALLFSPARSLIRCLFENEESKLKTVKPAIGGCWSACLQTLEGHSDPVTSVAFSPDGKLLASASDDSTVRLWDAGSGTVLRVLEGHSSSIRSVVFSLNGKLLASASDDKAIRLWDVSSGVALQILEGHLRSVRAVAFSRDGKLLMSASLDGTVRLWDTGSGTTLRTLLCYELDVNVVAFSPDVKLLASASQGHTIMLSDVSSGAVLRRLEGHSGNATAMVFSPDSKVLATASEFGFIRLWDAGSGAVLLKLKRYGHDVSVMAFSPDSKLLALASRRYSGNSELDDTFTLCETSSGAVLQTLEGYANWVNAVVFSPDGKLLASASADSTVRLWDAGSGAALLTLKDHLESSSAVSFSPNDKLQMPEAHSREISTVAFSPDGKLLASGSLDGTVRLWDAGSGAALLTLACEHGLVAAITLSPDGTLLASLAVGGVVSRPKSSEDDGIVELAVNGVGGLRSMEDRGTVELWDTRSGVMLQRTPVYMKIRTLSFSEDGTALRTDKGLIPLQFFFRVSSQRSHHHRLFLKEGWVATETENILWLPPEYRTGAAAVYGTTVAIGSESGRLLIFECCS